MPLLKIAQGPWTLLLKGSVKDRELEIYTNPQTTLYVQILQQENGRYTNGVCEFYKPYLATGDVSGFVQTLPREVVVLTAHQPDETHTFLLLGSSPISLAWDEGLVLEQTDILLKKLDMGSTLLGDVAKAYDITLKPMNENPPPIAEAFFAIPLLYPVMATHAHSSGEKENPSPAQVASGHMGALPGEFVLGTTNTGLMVKEPISFFKKVGVFNARIEHRTHILQVIAEGALFSNIPVVIVDWKNEFSVMRNPNPDIKWLHEQKIEGDPIGFPLKEFNAPENLKLELSLAYPEGLAEVLGMEGNELGQNLIRFLHEHRVGTVGEANGVLRQLPPSETFNAFQIASTMRILHLLDQTYPGLFTGMNPIEEISKSWFQSIGRVGVLRLQNVPPKLRRLLVYTLLRGIYEMYSQKGVSGRVRSLLVIPEAAQLFDLNTEPLLSKEIERLLGGSMNQDVGFILSSAHEIDLPKSLMSILDAKIGVVSGREAAVTLTGRKNYRASIRDTYSQPVVKDFFTL